MADHDLGGSTGHAQVLTPAAGVEGRRPPPQDAGSRPLARLVARIPISVRTKLLVAFALIVALLVAVGVLGLRVLGQSNARVEVLGTLQRRAATYQSLQTQAQQLRQLLAVRAAADPEQLRYAGGTMSAPVERGHRVAAPRPVDRGGAVAARPGHERVALRIRRRLPPTGSCSAGSARRTREFVATLDRMLVLDRAGRGERGEHGGS